MRIFVLVLVTFVLVPTVFAQADSLDGLPEDIVKELSSANEVLYAEGSISDHCSKFDRHELDEMLYPIGLCLFKGVVLPGTTPKLTAVVTITYRITHSADEGFWIFLMMGADTNGTIKQYMSFHGDFDGKHPRTIRTYILLKGVWKNLPSDLAKPVETLIKKIHLNHALSRALRSSPGGYE